MSKYVKDLLTKELQKRFDGVDDALLVNVIGMPNEQNVALRRQLRQKKINLVVVKNSLARRATEGTAPWRRRSRAPQARWLCCGVVRT